MTETVTLVGAGPGGAELLTCGGGAALRQADAVVYDRLWTRASRPHPEGARSASASARKGGIIPCRGQDQQPCLVAPCATGKAHCPPQGGDCYLFGRGGEECEYLKAHSVPFRVLPGVTSALAAPAFAGIPVTHRDFCSSVHIVTAHARRGSRFALPLKRSCARRNARVPHGADRAPAGNGRPCGGRDAAGYAGGGH